MKKRILSLFMALVMVFSLIPNAVLADVIKAGEKSYDVYTFSVDDAKVQEQTVKVGDTLLEPAAPEKAGYEFTGWYNGGSRFTGFGSVTSVAGTTINLEAKFSEAHYVFFLDDTGRVYTTKQGVAGDEIKADVEFPTEVNESIVGWYTDSALTKKVTSVTLADENIILYAEVAKGNYLTFDSTGGSYVEPQFVAQGANTAAPANPTRLGYTFSHWSETEGGSAFTFGSTITESKTLYAVWTASTNTQYTVIHWQENIDDENYSYKESETKTGTSGAQSAASAKSYSGFTAQAITQQTIAGDGSTIVNVYYDRNEYTVYFYGEECPIEAHSHDDCTLSCTTAEHQHSHNECCTKTGWHMTCNTSKCPYNGATHTHGDSCYSCGKTAHTHSYYCDEETVVLHSITAKHGAYIGDQWPGSTWRVNSSDDTAQSNLLYMPLGGEDFYDYERASGSESATYYTEVLDTVTSGGTVVGGVRYAVHHVDTAAGTRWTVTDEERYAIDGFTYVSGTSNGSSYNGAKFYYTRNDYQIIFMNGGAVANTITKQYQADISSVSYTPTRPANVPKGYEFVGWYSDAAGNAPYTFSGTMPSKNITVYAKWAAPVFDATFYVDVDVDVNGTVVKVPYAEAIDKAQIPEVEIPDDYEFIGWTTTKNDLSTLFNLDTRLYGDISLYPYFISTASFSVTYDLAGGSGSVSDSKVYAQDSHADVQSAAGISKANKVFLGWSYDDEIYYPGDKVLMPAANITLTAVWGDVLVTTSLTYKANGGVGKDVVISDLENNALLKAIANPSFTREGYTFLGWAKDAGAEAPQFVAGEQIRVDIGTNVLYAVWKIDQYEVSYAYTGTVPAGAPDEPTTAEHDYNSTVTVADEPTLDGYTFSGWTTEDATIIDGGFTMPAKNVKLTGEWSIRTDLSYTVNYYWNDTKEEVARSKVVDGCTFNETYTESPIPIDGCTAVSQTPQSVTITTGENVINFYYYKNVTLTANSKTEVYDGSEKSVSGFTGAPEGAVFSTITVGAKGTVVGEYPAEFAEGTVGTVGTVDDIAKYIVTEATDGKLTINPIDTEIVVTADSASQTYDGTALTDDGYTYTGKLASGDKLTATVSGSQTDVGTADNVVVKVVITNQAGKDVTASYSGITTEKGTLTVTKRQVILTSEGGSKTYDGTPLTNSTVSVSGDGFVEGEVTDIKATGSVTNVDEGEVTNTITYTEGTAFKADNYEITKNEGKLSITKRTVTLTSATDSKEYDGTALTRPEVTVTGDGFVEGEVSDIKATGTVTYVDDGEVTNAITYTEGDDFDADNYTITKNEGKLSITAKKAPIVITAASDTKPYDGTALTNAGYTYTGKLASGDKLTATVAGTQTNAGTAANKVTGYVVKNAAGVDITTSYTFGTSVDGTLTVTQRPVTLTSETVSKIYDGSALTNSKVTVTGDGFVEGEVTDIRATGSVTHVAEGAVTNTIKFTPAEGFLADNYTITKKEGQLSIAPRMVSLTSATASKVYDGSALTNSTVTVGGSGFAKDEGATYNVTGTQTQEGSSKNTFTYTLNKGTAATDYDITTQFGTLTVTALTDKVTVTITENSGSEKYDGTEKTVTGYTVSIDNALYTKDNFTFSGNDTIKGTDAGTYEMELKPENFTNESPNFTNVEFVIVDGTLEIAKRKVTLTSATQSKVYDGKALTNNNITVTGDGFAAGEGATYSEFASIIDVGSTDNTFTYTLNEGTSADNYDITVVEGKLTVTAITAKIVITANSNTKVYDGTALTDDGYTYAEELLAKGDVIVAVVEGTITDAGSTDNVVTSYKVMRGETDVTKNYTGITTAKGTLTITKRPVIITSPDAKKVYDGTALVNTNVTSEGFVEGEGASYIVTGSQLNVGSSVNEFTYTLNEGTKADNYTVTVVKGTLTVTPVTDKVTVTITEHSGEEVYDGTEKTVEGYDVAIDNALYTEDDFAFEGNDSVSGIYAGTYDMELKPENFTNTSDNFTNVEFVIVDGALVIKPVETEIVITADSNEKVYDGTALTDDGYTYDQSLLVEGDYIVAVVEGSQTNVGSSANKVTSYQILRGANAAREIVDVTDCYANVTTVDGTLTVTKRPVVLTSGSDSKVYDGKALTKEVVTVSGDGWAAGEGAAYSEFASITNVGSVNNSFTYTLNEGTNAANYDITVVEGVLTVNKYTDAKLEATGYTGVYDGQLHDGVTDKAVVNGIEGDEWTYTYSIDGENFVEEMPQYQDVGTYTVYVKATNDNYEGDALTTTVPVVITPATIVVTADDHVIATGDPDPELTYQVSTPVETETPAFDGILVRQEGAAKGEYPIEQGTLVLVDGEGFKASNYVLEYVPGTLTILQRAIDVEKTVDVDKAFVGDTITYTFVVTNTGEVDLQNVILIDEMLEIAGEIGALAIGETWTGELTYVATKEDVGQTLYNTVIVLAEGDTYDEDTSEGTTVYEPVPDTGDHTPVAALSAAMLVSLAGVIVLLRKQRKESAE